MRALNGGVGGGVRGMPADMGERSAWLEVEGERYDRERVCEGAVAEVLALARTD